MNTMIWIDLDEAARWLETRPDEVICLIQEGLLDSKRYRHAGIVVRADEVERLAKAFKGRNPRRRRVAFPKREPCFGLSQHIAQNRVVGADGVDAQLSRVVESRAFVAAS